jgi:hypothetical protein
MINRNLASVIFLIGAIIAFSVLGFAATFIPDDDGQIAMARIAYAGIFAFAVIARLRFWSAVDLMDSTRATRTTTEPDDDEDGPS